MLSPPPHQSPSVEQVDDNYDTIKAHYDVINPRQTENSEYASSVSETPQFSHQVN